MDGSAGIQEAELRGGFRQGGRILGLLVVARSDGDAPEYAIYIRSSWSRGYRILRTWRDKDDRTFRSLDKLYKLPPSFGHHAPITIYRAGCPELGRFRRVLARDGGARQASATGDSGASSPDGVDHDEGHPTP